MRKRCATGASLFEIPAPNGCWSLITAASADGFPLLMQCGRKMIDGELTRKKTVQPPRPDFVPVVAPK
jgi:hypothetical protein